MKIIYKIPGKIVKQTYIGVNFQTLKACLQLLHGNTNKPHYQALLEHIYTTEHAVDPDMCKILFTEELHKKRLTLEIIYTKTNLQSVNKKHDTKQYILKRFNIN